MADERKMVDGMPQGHKLGCTGKRSYATFAQAKQGAQRRNRRDGDAFLEPYKCRHCHEYHVGRNREREARRKLKQYRNKERIDG